MNLKRVVKHALKYTFIHLIHKYSVNEAPLSATTIALISVCVSLIAAIGMTKCHCG